MGFSACRILALEAETVSKGCKGENGSRCLAWLFCREGGSSQLLAKLHSANAGRIYLSGEGTA